MSEHDRIVELLGGARILGRAAAGAQTLIPAVERGIRFDAVSHIKKLYEIPDAFARRLLAVSDRTWARRKASDRLTPVESDRLYRLARVIARTEEVFGSRAKAALWLKEPNRALGARAPLDLLATDEGARRVEDVLVRIEHGVYG